MIEAAAHLPANIEKIPDGETFFAGEHGGDAVALDVIHGGAELPIDFSGAGNGGEVRVAERFGGLRFFEEAFLQCGSLVAEGGQLNRLERDGLAGLRIVCFVDRAGGGLGQFTQDFEVADFRGHGLCLITEKTAQLPEKTAWVQNPGQVEARIAPGGLRFELPKYLENGARAEVQPPRRDLSTA